MPGPRPRSRTCRRWTCPRLGQTRTKLIPKPTFIDDADQLEAFRAAVDELGGQRATAALLKVHERTIRDIVAPEGRRQLHTGFLRDVAAALVAKADRCRALERRLSPAFVSNLTADQAQGESARVQRYDRGRRETQAAPPPRAQVGEADSAEKNLT